MGDGGDIHRADRAQWMVPANPTGVVHLEPQLRQGDLPLSNDLAGGLLCIKGPHARFREVGEAEIPQAGNCLTLYKMRSLDFTERAIMESRRYLRATCAKLDDWAGRKRLLL